MVLTEEPKNIILYTKTENSKVDFHNKCLLFS